VTAKRRQPWGCIFDLDGTLLDSLGMWAAIDAAFLARRGIPVPPDYQDAVKAMRFRETAEYTIRRFGLPDAPEALMREWTGMAAEAYRSDVRMKPGAKAYLEALKGEGARLAVATVQPEAMFVPALEAHGIGALFDAVCSTDDVHAGKHRPDVYLLAASRMGVPPGRCAVFEDTLAAVRGAKLAGMRVYAVHDEANAPDWPQTRAAADAAVYAFEDAPLPPV